MELRENGFAHGHKGETPGKGQLALFCPVCPQPDINLPQNWKDDPNSYVSSFLPVIAKIVPDKACSWLYRRYLAVDGNFVLDHLISKNEGVGLIGGASFMAEPVRYKKHLKTTKESIEVSYNDLLSDDLYGPSRPSAFNTISARFNWGSISVALRFSRCR